MAGNYDGTLSGAYSIWHGGGQQETDQTVLTITKALTNTTNCAFIAKKRKGTTKKKFPALYAGTVRPLSNSFWRHCVHCKFATTCNFCKGGKTEICWLLLCWIEKKTE